MFIIAFTTKVLLNDVMIIFFINLGYKIMPNTCDVFVHQMAILLKVICNVSPNEPLWDM